MSYIVLYRDEFDNDVWNEYCSICKVSSAATSLKIIFDECEDVEAEYEDYEYEDDEDEDEEEYEYDDYEDDYDD